jgi:hypothetical protein
MGSDPGVLLEFPPLTFLAEDGEVVVGRPDRDLYVVLPPDGAALLRRLVGGSTPAQAAGWYADTYGETPDIDSFVETLRELQFLGPVAGPPAGRLRWQRFGRVLFSAPAWACFAVLVATCAVLIMRRPELAPNYRHLFVSRSIIVVELVLFAGQLPGLLLHEAFHALAGRRIGLRSRLRVGRRLYYLVAETSMDGLVGVPRRQRYLPILAGMLADTLWFSLLTVAAAGAVGADGWVGVGGTVCLALAFGTLLRLAWQFQFYLRTDLYVLVCTVLGLGDLHGAAVRRLRRLWCRLLDRPERGWEQAPEGAREGRHAGWYAAMLPVGYAVSILLFALAALPAAARFLSVVIGRLFDPQNATVGGLLDSGAFVVLNAAQLTVAVVLYRRSRRPAAGRPPTSSLDSTPHEDTR